MLERMIETTDGLKVKIRPLSREVMNRIESQIEKRYKDAGEPLSPPRYKVEAAGGAEEWFDHNATTVTTDEEKALWKAHKDAVERMQNEIAQAQSEYALLQGVAVDVPATDDWAEIQRMVGIDVPSREDAKAYKLYYINSEILKTVADQAAAVQKIYMLTFDGLPKEVLAEIEKSFRSTLYVEGTTETSSETDPTAN